MKNLTCDVPRRSFVHRQFACPCLVLLAGVTHQGCESDNLVAQPTVETETVVLSCGDWVRGRFYFLEERFHQFYSGYEMNVDWPAPI